MTQRQLADLSTVSVRAIRDLESGRASRPRTDTVRLIADGLGLRGTARSEFESASRAEPPAGAGGLPAPLGLMLGRDTERAELRALLASGTQRLVTLTGLPGVGKTRLAVDVATTLRDVDGLAATWCTDPGAAGAGHDGRPAVLVLDGVEPDTPLDGIIALLHRRGQLRVLCTARAPLSVPGERVVPLGPLAMPAATEADPDTLAGIPAVGLLLHHVAQVQPGFRLTPANAASVAGIASRLAGVPALLEAAAGWFLVYQPDELLSYLRCDPVGFTSAGWRDAVRHAVDQLDATGLAVLSALAEHAAPVTELAARTGLRLAACAAALGRLLLLGLATHGGSPGRFHVLEPVRTVWTGSPERTAAVLPLRLPVSAARAG